MSRTRIKFCGITRTEDARAAVAFGADAVGLVFARGPRRLEPAQGAAIAATVAPFVARVALFADPDAALVREVLAQAPIDALQFHGLEDDDFCASFGRPYLKALPMGEGGDAGAWMARYPRAQGFVLDAHRAGEAGGSGKTFDWSQVPAAAARPWLLAGGLGAHNVAAAIAAARPYGVDVSSGIESSPGLKDHDKMRAFVSEVRRADRLL